MEQRFFFFFFFHPLNSSLFNNVPIPRNPNESKYNRYFWGVGKTAFTFPKVYQHISFKSGEGDEFEGPLAIFTKSGVEVQLEISMQYRLIPEELDQLHEKYGKVYHQQVVNIARAAIKNKSPSFSVDDYVTRRENITAEFHQVLSNTLKEVHVTVPPRKLQLRSMTFPPQISERWVKRHRLEFSCKCAHPPAHTGMFAHMITPTHIRTLTHTYTHMQTIHTVCRSNGIRCAQP
jgi:hypothetical protein